MDKPREVVLKALAYPPNQEAKYVRVRFGNFWWTVMPLHEFEASVLTGLTGLVANDDGFWKDVHFSEDEVKPDVVA